MAKKLKSNPFLKDDWNTDDLQEMWTIIRQVAKKEFNLDFYEPSFEVVTFEEMLHIHTTGFPIMFNHWSFGKAYEDQFKLYSNNRTSIAYEVIFNTNPALCYLLETNTPTMQALVMCHAAIGHSAFFKGNSFFRDNTNANAIIGFLKNFRAYVEDCEKTYGAERVEEILDVCQTFSLYAFDRSEVIDQTKATREKKRVKRILEQEKDFDVTVAGFKDDTVDLDQQTRLKEDNILKFVAKNSPGLKGWERELILMFCKTQQYFYPQLFTKLMNEGYASFWHFTLMNKLYDLGYLKEGNILEFLDSHAGVLCQHDHDSKYYHGINVYQLGFQLFSEIRRICENPTEEDRLNSPHLIGKDWKEEIQFAMENFKDESFILQYLTPKIVRDLKLFSYTDDSDKDVYSIDSVHSDEDFKELRIKLAQKYNLFTKIPYMYVEGADLKRNRALYIVQDDVNDKCIEPTSLYKSLLLLKKLWPYPIILKHTDRDGTKYRDEVKE